MKQIQVQPGGADNGLGKGPFNMECDGEGNWTFTTPPAVPGFHYNGCLFYGVAVNDPEVRLSSVTASRPAAWRCLRKSVDFYHAKNVPHGEVRVLLCTIPRFTGSLRRAFVYTPPGYDADPGRRCPVLFLQHGAGEDERGWTTQGRANFILDNLIAAGKAKPMIVVMDNGYATKPTLPLMTPAQGSTQPPPPRFDFRAFEDVCSQRIDPGD